MKTALVVVIAVPLIFGMVLLRSRLNRSARELGERHQLPPGPKRLALGLGMATLFVVMGVLSLVLPADPWSLDEGRSFGIPQGFYGVALIPLGVLFGITIIRNRNKVSTRKTEPAP